MSAFTPRLKAIELKGTRIKFECSQGHTHWTDFGPKRKPSKRIGTAALTKMFHWWQQGGAIGDCPKCKRERLG